MTDLQAPAHTRRTTRLRVLPADLRPGDIIRDCGMDRLVTGWPTKSSFMDIVAVPLRPSGDYPTSLGIPAGQHVTAWRAA